MFFTVYKVTNRLNLKYYVGVHMTKNINDSYMGSGTAIKKAIAKHGKNNFTKEVLFVFDNREEAYNAEREITRDFGKRNTYNKRLGGVGGFSKESAAKGNMAARIKGASRKGGQGAYAKKVGIFAYQTEDHRENGRRGGLKSTAAKSAAHREALSNSLRESWKRRKLVGAG